MDHNTFTCIFKGEKNLWFSFLIYSKTARFAFCFGVDIRAKRGLLAVHRILSLAWMAIFTKLYCRRFSAALRGRWGFLSESQTTQEHYSGGRIINSTSLKTVLCNLFSSSPQTPFITFWRTNEYLAGARSIIFWSKYTAYYWKAHRIMESCSLKDARPYH